MNRVNNDRRFGAFGSKPSDDPSLARMRVHHVRPKLTQTLDQSSIGFEIPPDGNRAPHFVQDFYPITPRPRSIEQGPLRPNRRPGDQSHVMAEILLTLAGKECVFLCPPDDQAR